jgi:hypothetical protein
VTLYSQISKWKRDKIASQRKPLLDLLQNNKHCSVTSLPMLVTATQRIADADEDDFMPKPVHRRPIPRDHDSVCGHFRLYSVEFDSFSQVFILLETIYKAFDEIARRRRVFKVETVGDVMLLWITESSQGPRRLWLASPETVCTDESANTKARGVGAGYCRPVDALRPTVVQ